MLFWLCLCEALSAAGEDLTVLLWGLSGERLSPLLAVGISDLTVSDLTCNQKGPRILSVHMSTCFGDPKTKL